MLKSKAEIHIEKVRKIRLLGFIKDEQLSWSDHIDCVAGRMWQGIAMTRKCAQYVTPSVWNQVIQALVLTH